MLTIYKRQKINKATAKWIELFTTFYNVEGRLPNIQEMESAPGGKDRRLAYEIVKERIADK